MVGTAQIVGGCARVGWVSPPVTGGWSAELEPKDVTRLTTFADIQARLDRGEVIILDGATGTELQRRGVPMHGFAWSAAALDTHPETVRAVHEDYIRAGADVIITNSFATARHVLQPAGLGDRVRELNRRAVGLAQAARENAAAGRPVAIAGSISNFRADVTPAEQLEASYREQVEVLAEAGVDLVALEMMSGPGQAAPAIRAALATGLPTWVGFSCRLGEDGEVRLLDGSLFSTRLRESLALLGDLPPTGAAVTVMHTLTEATGAALEIVRRSWSGPIGAYAHSGRWIDPNWQFEHLISPEDYLGVSRQWVEMGAQIIGGCCGIGPDHIRLLKERLS
jgi:S-methylmethionine-dependent homocysteine/selenocysteine methylase